MSTPLRWLIGMTEHDQIRLQHLYQEFLAEIIPLTEELCARGARALQCILDTELSDLNKASVIIGTKFILDTRAITNNLRMGFISSCIIPERELVHQYCLLLFLHEHEEEASRWLAAKTTAQRRKFDFFAIKDKVRLGDAWYQLYDFDSKHGHINELSQTTFATLRRYYGWDLVVSGLWDPGLVLRWWKTVVNLAYWFQSELGCRYKGAIPEKHVSETDALYAKIDRAFIGAKERVSATAKKYYIQDSLEPYKQQVAMGKIAGILPASWPETTNSRRAACPCRSGIQFKDCHGLLIEKAHDAWRASIGAPASKKSRRAVRNSAWGRVGH